MMARAPFIFEHKDKPLISTSRFYKRQLKFFAYAFMLLFISLSIGMVGYRLFTGMDWVDAYLNAAMVLGGMGPVDIMPNNAAKIFAGSYAIFSGVVFLTTVAVLFAPLVHRLLHTMHIDDDQS